MNPVEGSLLNLEVMCFSSMNQASLQFRFSTEKGGEYLPTVCHRRNQWIVGGGGGGGGGEGLTSPYLTLQVLTRSF